MNNPLSNVSLSKGTQVQVAIVNEVDKATRDMGQEFTEDGKRCVINAMAGLVTHCKNQDIPFNSLDMTMVKIALRNVGFTELDFAATPAEAYYDIRKTDNGYSVSIRPQGAGNEKLTRRFGVNVQELKSAILVREKDEYTLPGFDGEKMTPFTWKPHDFTSKVIMVVYPLKKKDGSYEYLIGTREGIKPNLIAQIRQSNLYTFKKPNGGTDVQRRQQFYDEMDAEFEKMTVDQILADPKWRKELTPTYTSGGSVEAMVIRKMKNNALKNYPREYSNTYQAEAVKDMYEDVDQSLNEKPQKFVDVDMVAKVEEEIAEPVSGDAPKDFEVDGDGVVEKEEPTKEPEPTPTKTDNYEEEI